MLDLKTKVNVSLQAVAQILLACGTGIWMAKRHGLNKKAIGVVASVNWHTFIPALLFSSIIGAIDSDRIRTLWPIIIFSLLHLVISAAIALVAGLATRLPRDILFFTVMTSCLPNCGNLPWLMLPIIVRQLPLPSGSMDESMVYMTGLVSVYTIVIMLIVPTVPFMFGSKQNQSSAATARQQPCLETAQPDAQPQPSVQHTAAAEGTAKVHGLATALPPSPQHINSITSQPPFEAAAAGVPTTPSPAAGGPLASPAGPDADPEFLAPQPCLSQDPSTDFSAEGSQPQPWLTSLPQWGVRVQRRLRQLLNSPLVEQLPEILPPPALRHSPSMWQRMGSFRSGSQLYLGGPVTSYSPGPNLRHVPSNAVHWMPGSGLWVRMASFKTPGPEPSGSQPSSPRRAHTGTLGRSSSCEGAPRAAGSGAASSSGSRQPPVQPQRSVACCGLCAPWGWMPGWLLRVQAGVVRVLESPMVNRPMGATLLALVVAAVGPARDVFVKELQPLNWVWRGLSWIGAACAPLATMQMGAELVQTPGTDAMKVRKLHRVLACSIAIVVKLVLLPLINVALLQPHIMGSWLPPNDPIYKLVILLEAAVPGAVTLLVVCMRVYPDIAPLSQMLFWQYVASLITLPCMLVWFLGMPGVGS